VKPTTFDGRVKYGQEAQSWLLGIQKYFEIHEYSRNMNAIVLIFNLKGRAFIWWDLLRQMKKISERKITWKKFKR
jgi:hypothetical protein